MPIAPSTGKNPFVNASAKVSEARVVYTGQEKPSGESQHEIRMAFVSFPVEDRDGLIEDHHIAWPVGAGGTVGSIDQRQLELDAGAGLHGGKDYLALYANAPRGRVMRKSQSITLDRFVAAVRKASERARIICCNELAFPVGPHGPLRKAMDEVLRIAQERNALIIAGSAHDKTTLYNTSLVFFPFNESPQGNDVEKRGYNMYHKQISAWSGPGEVVQTPPIRYSFRYQFEGLKIGVLVCSDMLDYSAVAAHIHGQLLLVPCWSTMIEKMTIVARATSLVMRGPVVLVNCSTTKSTEDPARRLLVYQSDVGETERPLRHVGREELPCGTVIDEWVLHRNLLENLSCMKIADSHKGDSLKWLFGAEGMTSVV